MKKRIIAGIVVGIVVLFLLVFNFAFLKSSGVERSFSKDVVSPGEAFQVELDIRLENNEKYYLLEETAPEGFLINDDNAKGNVLKLVDIQNAESVVYTYEVVAPEESGEYSFFGEYSMEGTGGVLEISGDSLVVVG